MRFEQVVRPALGNGQQVLNKVGCGGFLQLAKPLVLFDGYNYHDRLAPAE